MAVGDPIVLAIAAASSQTACEIRVHISRRLFDFHPRRRAQRLFERFKISHGKKAGAVLLYFNLRRRRFAIVGDPAVDQALGAPGWQELGRQLTDDLRATDPERAIAQTIARLSQKLHRHFPEETLS